METFLSRVCVVWGGRDFGRNTPGIPPEKSVIKHMCDSHSLKIHKGRGKGFSCFDAASVAGSECRGAQTIGVLRGKSIERASNDGGRPFMTSRRSLQ